MKRKLHIGHGWPIAIALLLVLSAPFASASFRSTVTGWASTAITDFNLNGHAITDSTGSVDIGGACTPGYVGAGDVCLSGDMEFTDSATTGIYFDNGNASILNPTGTDDINLGATGNVNFYAISIARSQFVAVGRIDADGGLRLSSDTITDTSGTVTIGSDLKATTGVYYFQETTTPTPVVNYGALYTKSDNIFYFQDGGGTEHALAGIEKDLVYTYRSGSLGTHFPAGYYDAPAADANLTQASPTVTYGSAAAGARGGHAFLVAGGPGSVDAGTVSIVVSGTSYDPETATRTTSDTETLVADITAMSANNYFETTKQWLGQITYTLTPAGATTYSADFNYGFAVAEENHGLDFTVKSFHCQIDGGATDTGLDIELLHHKSTGWTYHATTFVPGDGALASCATTYSTDCKVISDTYFNYSELNLNTPISASTGEGVVIRVTTGANNSISNMTCHVGAVD